MSSLLQLMPGLESGEPAGGMGRETGGGGGKGGFASVGRQNASCVRMRDSRMGQDWFSGLVGWGVGCREAGKQGSRAELQQDES